MPGLPDLSPLALYPLFADLARQAADVAPAALGGTATRTILDFLASRFTDPSRRLPAALARAQDRAWRALEVALAGETFWAMLTRRGEDKALSAELRHFLDANPLNLAPQQDAAFRRRAAEQLRQARADGLLPTAVGSPDDLAVRCASLTRFAGAAARCDAEWAAVAEVAADLRGSRHDALADLLSLRPDATQPPLLAVAVRFFFRREVETHEELFRGLTYDTLTDLRGDLRTGLGALLTALERQEGWLAGLLAVAEETRDRVADVQDEIRRVNDKLDRLLDRDPRPDDSFSIRNEAERRLVRAVVARYRTLSEEDRRRLPHLLHAIARLEQSAGDLDDSLRDFQQEAAWTEDRVAKAKAHYGAYLTALERRHWDIALDELQRAATLAPARYVPFPLKKYLPERILGAGGFGVVVLCKDAETGARLAVKALRTDELDRDAATVIAEAEQLETLEHDNIIRLRTAGFADTERTRPYLVMSYFDGTTLDEYVHKNGPLSPDDAREVARQMASGLQAAHERGILHRDVKPANVMARKADGRWQVKLIDFGLALRRQAAGNPEALQSTSRGKSITGTMEYAAPEQMGKVKADIGPHSDVFGFGRTICFLLFQNPQPGPDEWEQLTDGSLRKLLGGCLKREPKERFPTFAEVRQQLGTMAPSQRSVPSEPAPTTIIVTPVAPVQVEVFPAPQVPPGDLPPLPEEILTLEGRLNGLEEAIASVDNGSHPSIQSAWIAVTQVATGDKALTRLKEEIAKNPTSSAAELCALAPEVPHSPLLAVINALKRVEELKKERDEVRRELCSKQEADFQAILARGFAKTESAEFPLAAWLTWEPMFQARRYRFISDGRDLLRKGEEHFVSFYAKKEAERIRYEQEKEQARRQQEEESLRTKREKERARLESEEAERQRLARAEEERKKQEEQAAQNRLVLGTIAACVVLGTIGFGLIGAAIGGFGWLRSLAWLLILVVGALFFFAPRYSPDPGKRQSGVFFLMGWVGIVFVAEAIANCCGTNTLSNLPGGNSAAAVAFGIYGGILGGIVGLIASAVLLKR